MKENLSYVASDVEIEGTILCEGPIRIDGNLKGSIEGKNSVTVGTPAQIKGPIRAHTMVINGDVQGDLVSSDKVSILANGRIKGEVYTPPGGVSIARGGFLEGGFHPEPSSPKPKKDV